MFCLLWLISASAHRIGYITDFCSMIELLHEFEKAAVNIEAFRHLVMPQQETRKTKSLLNFYTRNQGGEAPLDNFSPPWKNVLDINLKILDIVQKIWTPLGKLFAPPGVPGWLRACLYITKNQKFSCVLYAHSQFLRSSARFDLSNRGVCQPVQSYFFYARLLEFDKTLAQPHFAVVNCSDALMSVFLLPCLHAAWYFCSYELLCRSI